MRRTNSVYDLQGTDFTEVLLFFKRNAEFCYYEVLDNACIVAVPECYSIDKLTKGWTLYDVSQIESTRKLLFTRKEKRAKIEYLNELWLNFRDELPTDGSEIYVLDNSNLHIFLAWTVGDKIVNRQDETTPKPVDFYVNSEHRWCYKEKLFVGSML